MRNVCVVLPAYNESAGLLNLVRRIGQDLRDGGLSYEMIIVDDGSTDETWQQAEEASRIEPVQLQRHVENRGYGRALETGLRAAESQAEAIVTMDADCSHDPSLIVRMLAEVRKGGDVVIASRFQNGGAEIGVPLHRRVLSHGASRLGRLVFSIEGVRDFTSGYRAYSNSLLRSLIEESGARPLIEESGFTAGLELLLKAATHGATVSEVPLALRYDQKESSSGIRIGLTALQFLRLTAAHSYRRVNGAEPARTEAHRRS